ncbi:LuxR C-terminal-related transcriptional regulator [Streptomyces sp. NPDC127033]|uniref:LuxR C-terminal-related transcriptional regulator n=1 Tax=Streptomyces sp. NPDC127033 TaxID=3347110 RepID=UPI0036491C53
MLESLGLDERTSSVYQLMVLHQDWGMSEIGSHLDLAPQDVRDALDRLARLSLLRVSSEAPGMFSAINPSISLAALLTKQEGELEEQRARVSRARQDIAHLTSEWVAARETHGFAERLIGVDAVRNRLDMLAEEAESEVISFMPGGAQSAAALAASRPLDERHLERGVRMRTVYLDSVRNDRPTREYAAWLAEIGGHIRTTPTLPLRMVIADRRTALVPLDPGDSKQGALILMSRGVVTALTALFEVVWETSVPFGVQEAQPADDVSAQERELLRLLRSGLTDEGVARQLGVSVRTTRRMVASVMERLEARGRFEAGYEAAKRGWL